MVARACSGIFSPLRHNLLKILKHIFKKILCLRVCLIFKNNFFLRHISFRIPMDLRLSHILPELLFEVGIMDVKIPPNETFPYFEEN